MTLKRNRFTISLPPGMREELESAKQGPYREVSYPAMLRDLIRRGLLLPEGEEGKKEERDG